MGVIVAVEHINRSHTSNVGNTTKEIIDLVNAINSPSFQIMAQIQTMAYTDLDLSASIRAMGDRIKLVHIADVPGFNPIVDRVLPMIPGKGKLDFLSIFKAFKAIGYDGEICMEPRPGSPGLIGKEVVSELSAGRKLLEAKWKQA
jgi:sugar phosphate isomerase/epimerase